MAQKRRKTRSIRKRRRPCADDRQASHLLEGKAGSWMAKQRRGHATGCACVRRRQAQRQIAFLQGGILVNASTDPLNVHNLHPRALLRLTKVAVQLGVDGDDAFEEDFDDFFLVLLELRLDLLDLQSTTAKV